MFQTAYHIAIKTTENQVIIIQMCRLSSSQDVEACLIAMKLKELMLFIINITILIIFKLGLKVFQLPVVF